MLNHREQIVDELLVMDAQNGRVKAMELLASRWQEPLWRYAWRLTGDTEAAWDVTQEAWLGIVRGITRLSDPARFRHWVFRIVTNKANDWIRRSTRTRRIPEEGRASVHEQDKEMTDELHRILQCLPEQSRTVLTLYYLEEFALSDVARILQVPEGTVKSRLHTARAAFKELWQAGDEAQQTNMSADRKGEVRCPRKRSRE